MRPGDREPSMPPCLPAESPADSQAATVSEADSPALRTIAGGGAPGDLAPTRRRPVEAARRRCRAPTAVPPRLPRPLGWSWGDDDGAPQTPLPAPMALGRAAPLFPRLSQSLNGLTELIVGLGGGGKASYFIGCLLERYYGLSTCRSGSECHVGFQVGLVLVEGALGGFLATCAQRESLRQN